MTTQIKAGVIAANAITATELASSALSGGSFTGDVTFDTNTLVVDSTNNRVGVGTASPNYPLEIQGTGTVTLAYQRTGVSAKKWGFHSDNDNTYWQNITDNVLGFTLSNAGNVGIGTTASLDSRLEINATSSASSRIKLKLNDTPYCYFGGYSGIVGSGNADDVALFAWTGKELALGSNSTERMRITSAGNVGIGTTITFSNPLTINKAAGAAGSLNNQLAMTHTGASTAYYLKTIRAAATDEPTGLAFFEHLTERMRIDGSGNVGIGTSSPDARLDIHMSDSNGTYGRGFDGNLNLENTNTSVTEGGWMSISGYTGNAANSGQYMMGAITGGKQTTAADGDYGGYLSLWTTSGGAGGEANSGMYERMRIDSTGNIIVRTTTANSALSSIQALSAALQLNTPGVDDKGGHIFMTQLAAENTWMNIVQCHDDGATGVLFLIHGVRTIDQNRSYGALVRYAYSDTFNVISVNQQNTTIEYRVSGNALQYRFTSPGPYVVNLSVMAAG